MTDRKTMQTSFALSVSQRTINRPSSSLFDQKLPKTKSTTFSNPKFMTKEGNLPISRLGDLKYVRT